MRLKVAFLLAAASWPMPLWSQGARVFGVVYDSLAHAPLSGAIVQLAPADHAARFSGSAISDSLGRFAIDSVPDGKYAMGFFHPMLDSLAIAPPLREVVVTERRSVHADIAIPSSGRLRAAVCGGTASADTGGFIIGVVRDAKGGTPLSGASVVGQWFEITLGRGGMRRNMPRLEATTGDNGWFAICNVPRRGTMWLRASRGVDSTTEVELSISGDGFVRRDLYLGSARTTLSGIVKTRSDSRPVGNARISTSNGSQTRSNDRGEWTLPDVPMGTRRLEVRAIGYYPEFRAVDVQLNGPPIHVAMETMKSVLDTIRVTAAAVRLDEEGFRERQRSGMGKYYTAEAIARLNPVSTSDIFRQIPGVKQEGGSITMRGIFEDRCVPVIYIDGMLNIDLDSWVQPARIKAMEVYMPGTAPVEYERPMQGCGVILIWTKRP